MQPCSDSRPYPYRHLFSPTSHDYYVYHDTDTLGLWAYLLDEWSTFMRLFL